MGDTTRDRILDGAIELIQATTVNEFNMARLAEWTGVSRKTIYNHFASKSALISEAITIGMDRIIRNLVDIAEDTTLTFPDKIDRIVEHSFREMSHLWDPVAWLYGSRRPMETRTAVRRLNRHILQLTESIVTEATTAGLLAPNLDPHIFSHIINTIITGIRFTDDHQTLPCTPMELMRQSLRAVLTGTLSPHGLATLANSPLLSTTTTTTATTTNGDTP